MSAIECKADVPQRFVESQNLNVCFSRKRSFKFDEKHQFDRPLTAKRGHGKLSLTTKLNGGSVALWNCRSGGAPC